MLYNIDKQSKINLINLVNSFMLLDGNKTEEECKLLNNLEKYLLEKEKFEKTLYEKEVDILKVFSEISFEFRKYLKDILLEINEKNNYKEDGLFSSPIKNGWEDWIKSNLKV